MIGQFWRPADHDPRASAVTVHNGRLARFLAGPTDQEYWSRHWQEDGQIAERLRRVAAGSLGSYDAILARHALPNGVFLEAGCGTGYVAEILRLRGYNVIALDYDARTMAEVKEVFPDLDTRVGDVEMLDLPDASIENYISLGVLEHFEHGPERAIREAHRVMKRDGRAFISVPDLNPARRSYERYLRAGGRADGFSDSCTFNYYYYDRGAFSMLLEAGGLVVEELVPLFKLGYLTNEHPLFSRFWRSPLCRDRLKQPLRQVLTAAPRVHSRYSHMMMYVCAKKA